MNFPKTSEGGPGGHFQSKVFFGHFPKKKICNIIFRKWNFFENWPVFVAWPVPSWRLAQNWDWTGCTVFGVTSRIIPHSNIIWFDIPFFVASAIGGKKYMTCVDLQMDILEPKNIFRISNWFMRWYKLMKSISATFPLGGLTNHHDKKCTLVNSQDLDQNQMNKHHQHPF